MIFNVFILNKKINFHFLNAEPKSYIPGPGDKFVILKTSLF